MDEFQKREVGSKSAFLRNTGIALFLFTVIAFALKAFAHPERIARYTPLVTAHGIVMVGWLAFFAMQAGAIVKGNTTRHIRNGKLSWILVALMIGISMPVSYSLMAEFNKPDVFIGNSFMLIAFLGFFLAAIYSIRHKDRDSHKRYMLFACLSIIMPAIGRIADVISGQEALVTLAIFPILVIILPVLYDRSQGRPVHRATKIGIAGSFTWVVVMMIVLSSSVPNLLLEMLN